MLSIRRHTARDRTALPSTARVIRPPPENTARVNARSRTANFHAIAETRLQPFATIQARRPARSIRHVNKFQLSFRDVCASIEEPADTPDRLGQIIGIRKKHDPNVVRSRPVEAGSLHEEHLLFQQQIEDELLVIDDRVHLRIETQGKDTSPPGV